MKNILTLMLKGVIFEGILILLILAFIMIRIALKGIRLYEFYYPNGKISSRAYLNRYGEFEDLEKKFYDNRKLKSKILFKNGIEEKILESYDKDGNKIKDNL